MDKFRLGARLSLVDYERLQKPRATELRKLIMAVKLPDNARAQICVELKQAGRRVKAGYIACNPDTMLDGASWILRLAQEALGLPRTANARERGADKSDRWFEVRLLPDEFEKWQRLEQATDLDRRTLIHYLVAQKAIPDLKSARIWGMIRMMAGLLRYASYRYSDLKFFAEQVSTIIRNRHA